jgi:hypothetical protein
VRVKCRKSKDHRGIAAQVRTSDARCSVQGCSARARLDCGAERRCLTNGAKVLATLVINLLVWRSIGVHIHERETYYANIQALNWPLGEKESEGPVDIRLQV